MLEGVDGDAFRAFLTNPERRDSIFEMADAILAGKADAAASSEAPIIWGLAAHLAESRRKMLAVASPTTVGVVFAMWREVRRLLPASDDNPSGEDCLMHKITSLDWLCRDTKVAWKLYAVDDDCPQASYATAQAVASHSVLRDQVTVMRLTEQLPSPSLPLSRLETAAKSIKGGAIIAGAQQAIADGCDAVGYTDCDNSVHLGQLGLLLEPVLAGAEAAFGNRFAEGSRFHWDSRRQTSRPGSLLIQHMRRMLPGFKLSVIDVAVPFKLFSAAYLADVLPRLSIFDFAFDIDVMMALAADGVAPARASYVLLDSFEESSWHHHGDASVQLQIIRGWVQALRAHGLPHEPEIAMLVDRYLNCLEDVDAVLSAEGPAEMAALDLDSGRLGQAGLMPVSSITAWLESTLGQRVSVPASNQPEIGPGAPRP